jgi:hypothetical protein
MCAQDASPRIPKRQRDLMKRNVPSTNRKHAEKVIPDVVGGAELVAKQSDVDAQGRLRNEPIDGVVFRPTRPVPHDDGHVTEVARASWEMLGGPVVQVHRW